MNQLFSINNNVRELNAQLNALYGGPAFTNGECRKIVLAMVEDLIVCASHWAVGGSKHVAAAIEETDVMVRGKAWVSVHENKPISKDPEEKRLDNLELERARAGYNDAWYDILDITDDYGDVIRELIGTFLPSRTWDMFVLTPYGSDIIISNLGDYRIYEWENMILANPKSPKHLVSAVQNKRKPTVKYKPLSVYRPATSQYNTIRAVDHWLRVMPYRPLQEALMVSPRYQEPVRDTVIDMTLNALHENQERRELYAGTSHGNRLAGNPEGL